MKAKLLKKIRRIGRSQIAIYSVAKTTTWSGEIVTGMSYSYNNDAYRGLFDFGDTEARVRDKAMKIYIEQNIGQIRDKYKKYSRKNKKK